MNMHRLPLILVIFLLTLIACDRQSPIVEGDHLQLMATTSIVGDIVLQVGGDLVTVDVLLPLGTDPHSFNPTPHDIARLAKAKLVFINGAGLEEFLYPMIESAEADVRLIDLSGSIMLRSLGKEAGDAGQGGDPHTWMDPNNIVLWTQIISAALIEADPEHQDVYRANAERLSVELEELDRWVMEQVAQIPTKNRKLVTDHLVFGYFADRYGFEQVGAIIPGFSTLSEPSAQELAILEDAITQLDVAAIFVGWTANPSLADRIAEDTGVSVVPLFTHSLSVSGGEAEHYQDFIRYNVRAIVSALR